MARTYPNQFLIVIRSLTTLYNYSWSKTRLIVIMNLTAKLGIIHATLQTALDCPSINYHCRHTHTLLLIQTRHVERGRWRLVSQLQQQLNLGHCNVLCWLPLIASRNIGHPFCHCLPDSCTYCCSRAYKFLPDDNAKSLLLPANVECSHSNRWKQSQPATPTRRPTNDDRLSTPVSAQPAQWPTQGAWSTVPHWVVLLIYHWLLSAVDDVTIMEHFVVWSRHALNVAQAK